MPKIVKNLILFIAKRRNLNEIKFETLFKIKKFKKIICSRKTLNFLLLKGLLFLQRLRRLADEMQLHENYH